MFNWHDPPVLNWVTTTDLPRWVLRCKWPRKKCQSIRKTFNQISFPSAHTLILTPNFDSKFTPTHPLEQSQLVVWWLINFLCFNYSSEATAGARNLMDFTLAHPRAEQLKQQFSNESSDGKLFTAASSSSSSFSPEFFQQPLHILFCNFSLDWTIQQSS